MPFLVIGQSGGARGSDPERRSRRVRVGGMVDVLAATSADVHAVLSQRASGPLSGRREQVARTLREFVDANEGARASPNLRDERRDELGGITSLLTDADLPGDQDLALLALKTLKILSRKEDNRRRFGRELCRAVVRLALTHPRASHAVTAEGANVVLNACYEKENVEYVLECGGVEPLVRRVADTGETLRCRSAAAGAVQSVCFQAPGRCRVRDCDGVAALVALMKELDRASVPRDGVAGQFNDDERSMCRARVVGALHNVSADDDAIRLIRACDGVPHLVRALGSDDDGVCGSAAGATQNVSRERASRALFRRGGAVEALTKLLARGSDPATQARAAGALLNILGPDLDDGHSKSGEKARADEGDDASDRGSTGDSSKENDTKTNSRGSNEDAPTALSGSRSSGSGRVPAEGSERRALGRLLSSAMALTAVWDGLFETTPTFDPKVSA